ncbi:MULTISPECIES: RNA polymerase sigma factor [unclassified Paenibacillus]|uniref:RNA polymerase sigma factor n=1 Tax=unclassified Paenibacillus TaxID=185978 RepID=UPI0027839C77|nr:MULTISPECIES: sigma-70 family RNA polymerase sigma factor [unclassified Paenibacillus]MDQ0896437.1 RNA polymerase sigma factor (sigma-70 family) [Paenibacillus sp. V4I7]MDQ0914019.1 RNA polymerase sigma factor (sigma-70 family) [Paenibacillus sp. V4I5]
MEECLERNEKNSEIQWISSVLDGRKEDYAFVVNRYRNKIYGLLRGMGADHQDAQDLTQETFIKAYRKLASHNTNKSFAAWLYTIAANLLKDMRRRSHHTEWLADPPPDHPPCENPEMVLLQEEQRTEVQVLIQQLPLNYRIVLLLRYTNDLSYVEMSEVLDVPINKVQNDLYRAKKRLKQMMTVEEVRTDGMLKPR